MEGNEEEDLLLSSFSLCHSLNSHLFYLSEFMLVHYALLTTRAPEFIWTRWTLTGQFGPREKASSKMEESSQEEDPDEALKKYYAKMKEKKKKWDEKKGGKKSVSGEAESTGKEGCQKSYSSYYTNSI